MTGRGTDAVAKLKGGTILRPLFIGDVIKITLVGAN